MGKSHPKISAAQLFCILMVSRLSSEMVYPRTVSGTALEAVLAVVISELVRFLLALPLIIYSFGGNNVHRSVYNKNRFFGWTGAVFAAMLLLGGALRTMLNLSQFTVKNLLPGGTVWIVFALAAIFAVYCAAAGVEAAARAGAIFLVMAAIVTAVVMLGVIPYINSQSFESFGRFGDNSGLLGEIIERVMRGGDYLIFAAMLPYVSYNRKSELGRTAVLFTVFSTLAVLLVCSVSCLVLRGMFGQSEYPFTAVASLADIALFKRLDGFSAAAWSLCGAFRCGVMALSAELALLEVYRASRSMKKEAAQ